MDSKFILAITFWLISSITSNSLFAQRPYQATSLCENHNAFMHNGQVDSILPYIARVMGSGALLLDPAKEDSLFRVFVEMELDSGTSFQLVNEFESLRDSITVYKRYQQYYQGLPVEGGGYTMAFMRPGGPHPCIDFPSIISPYIKGNIDVSVEPVINKSTLPTILDSDTIYDADLVIAHNLEWDCEYLLAYKVNYLQDSNKVSWVDAISGDIIITLDGEANIIVDAPTVDYGPVSINNFVNEGEIFLQSPNEDIIVYDMDENEDYRFYLNDASNWTQNLIPTTIEDGWTNEANLEVFQAFYSTEIVKPIFESIGIEFETYHVGVLSDFSTAVAGNKISSQADAYAIIGASKNNQFVSLSLIDIIAHEFAHNYIRVYHEIKYNSVGNNTLHEAISDMIAVYTESKHQLSTDWIIADDNQNTAVIINRDLENPLSQFDCFTEVEELEVPHDRGRPLGHWFYLISEGGTNIPGIGIDEAYTLIYDALANIPLQADYFDFMTATLTIVEDRYGICSDEFETVANAWETICVPTGFPTTNGFVNTCSLQIYGPNAVCEEDDGALFCVPGAASGNYKFTILGKRNTDFESVCGMIGNWQEGCSCLDLIDFPKYPYYPQYITIEVRATAGSSKYVQRKRVKLVDCNNDDPTCQEFYNLEANYSEEDHQMAPWSETTSLETITPTNCDRITVYDLLGRRIQSIASDQFLDRNLPKGDVLIIVFHDNLGNIIKSEKRIYFE